MPEEQKQEQRIDLAKRSFMVIALGYWGRGPNVKQAAEQCLKAGARRSAKVNVVLVLGDDEPATDGWMISRNAGSEVIRIGFGLTLGALLGLKDCE